MAMNPVTGKPLAGVKLTAALVDNETDPKKLKQDWRDAATARNGEAILNFAPMGEPGDDLDVKVEGTLSGAGGALAHDEVTAEIDVLDRTTVHVEMDKPLHKPGEMVHMRALAFRDSGRVADGEPVTLTINDPDNKKLVAAKLKTNRFGIVQYDWKRASRPPWAITRQTSTSTIRRAMRAPALRQCAFSATTCLNSVWLQLWIARFIWTELRRK